MKKSIVLTALCAINSCAWAQASSPPGSVLSAAGGRFVFGQISEYRRDQYLLDTLTGRLWRSTCAIYDKDDPKKCNLTAMEPIDFIDSNGKLSGTSPPVK